VPIEDREPVWLVIEWPLNDEQAGKFYLTTLPRRMSHKQLVPIIKERWRTERMYEDLKGELGLDHFEGPSWVGTITSPSSSAATPSSSPSESALFPPRLDGRMATTRSRSRPERHFADSFITIRLAFARALVDWLPRWPLCHRASIRVHLRDGTLCDGE